MLAHTLIEWESGEATAQHSTARQPRRVSVAFDRVYDIVFAAENGVCTVHKMKCTKILGPASVWST